MLRNYLALPDSPDVEREYLRAMVERAHHSVFANVIGLGLLVIACFFVPFGHTLALAVGLRGLAIANTARNTRQIRRLITLEEPLERAVNKFMLGMVFAGFTWGSLFWAIPPEFFHTLQGSMVRSVALTGVALVALTAAPVPRVMLAFVTSFAITAGSHFLLHIGMTGPVPLLIGMGLLAAILSFATAMTRQAHQAAQMIIDNREMATVLKGLNKEIGEALNTADRLARFDRLTGLHNRFSFEEHCATLKEHEDQLGERQIILIDLDNFKSINDSCGHDGGDAVLRRTGKLLTSVARAWPTSAFAARIGGEEFAIVLPAADAQEARSMAENICARMRRVDPPEGYDGSISASIGMACWRRGEELHVAMKRADDALYLAKRSGRDRAICEKQLAA